MRYKLLLPCLVVVAAALSLLLALHHLDARRAPTAQPLQSFELNAQGMIGASTEDSDERAINGAAAAEDATSSCDGNAPGMADPAAVYCDELGYEFQIVDGAKGQYGVCVLPDGSSCDAWRFLEGTCGQGYSYCAKQGYDIITKTDGKNSLSRAYSVCVQGQQEIGPVTELMRLSEKATRGSSHAEQRPSSRGALNRTRSSICPCFLRLEELQWTGLDDLCEGTGDLRRLLGVFSRRHSRGGIQHQHNQP
jgi:putative hemolysin